MGRPSAIFLLFVASTAVISKVSSLDCSLLVEEVQSGLLNWLGDVTFVVPVSTDEEGWLLVMTFDQPFLGVGVWDVYAESNGTAKWSRISPREDNLKLTAGEEFFYRFRVIYNVDQPKPQVVSLNFQGIELCK